MLHIFKAGATALRQDRRAIGALEYALVGSIIAVAVIGGTKTFGIALAGYFIRMAMAAGFFAA